MAEAEWIGCWRYLNLRAKLGAVEEVLATVGKNVLWRSELR